MELNQDYGINISFTCGLSLQQDFHWLVGISPEQVGSMTHNMELYFEEEDFDGFVKKLSEYPGVRHLGGVVEHGWGQRVVRFYDLDGHLLEVGEPLVTVIQRFQAAGLSMEEISKRMDVSVEDLNTLLQQ